MEYEYDAAVLRVIDGDSVWLKLSKTREVELDFGFYIKELITVTKTTEQNFRLAGIDTPEIRGGTPETKELGNIAKEELKRLLSLGSIRVISHKAGKYGRWLVTLYVTPNGQEEFNVNQYLLEKGFAKEYPL